MGHLFLFLALLASASALPTQQDYWNMIWRQSSVPLQGGTWTWTETGTESYVLREQTVVVGPGALIISSDRTVVAAAGQESSLTLRGISVAYPSLPTGPTRPADSGPLPGIDVTGGQLVLEDTVIMAPFAALKSLRSFWDGVPVSVSTTSGTNGSIVIQSYRLQNITMRNVMLLPTDYQKKSVECYTGGVPVYDSASLLTALEGSAQEIFIAKDILLDPKHFSYRSPVNITDRAVEMYGCAGTSMDLNYNWTRHSVTVASGGALSLRNLSFTNAPIMNQLLWPRHLAPLLGLVDVALRGSCRMIQCNITSPTTADLKEYVTQFTKAADASARPIYSVLEPTYAYISSWRLTGSAVWPASPGISITAAQRSSWELTDVAVRVRPSTCTASDGAIGIRVTTGSRLRELLSDPLIPALEVGADLTFVASEWPPEASGPDAGKIFVNRTKEVYACHPTPGERYTIDFGNLGQVVFVFGTLRWRGSLMMTHPRASARRSWLYLLVGALSVETDGVILFEGVQIHSNVTSPFTNADDSFWQTNCGSLCSSFMPDKLSYRNMSYYDAFIYDYKFYKSDWVAVSQARNITGAGFWGYTDVAITWRPDNWNGQFAPAVAGSSKDDVPVAAIAAPVVLGSVLLLAVGAALGIFVYRRRRGPNANKGASFGSELSSRTSNDVLESGRKGSKDPSMPVAGSAGLHHVPSVISSNMPTEARIEDMKRAIGAQALQAAAGRQEQITLLELIGEGTFGKVYRGSWHGSTVAVKIMVFPSNMSGKEKREKMAVMETAISSSLSHPNIVQTYTYAVLPVKGDEGSVKLSTGKSVTIDSTSPLEAMSTGDQGNVHSWEVRLVLEFCDRGSLRDVLSSALAYARKCDPAAVASIAAGAEDEDGEAAGPQLPLPPPSIGQAQPQSASQSQQQSGVSSFIASVGRQGQDTFGGGGGGGGAAAGGAGAAITQPSVSCPMGYVAVIDTMLDVARAMLHMHSENIVHGDLKARNILLKSGGSDGRAYAAKVSDFGLSLRIDPHATHVSNVYQGTITHMAPEVLLAGKISKASDVYAFAILMWEAYTAGQAFKGTPRALLGHEVTKMNRRPQFPLDTPFDYQLLACRCWESDPTIRPNFDQIISDLSRMRSKALGAGGGLSAASSFAMPAPSAAGATFASGVAGGAGGGTETPGHTVGGTLSSVQPLQGVNSAGHPQWQANGASMQSERTMTEGTDYGALMQMPGGSSVMRELFVLHAMDGSTDFSGTDSFMMPPAVAGPTNATGLRPNPVGLAGPVRAPPAMPSIPEAQHGAHRVSSETGEA